MSAPNFTPLAEVRWRDIRYLKTPLTGTDEDSEWAMTLNLPEPLASWDVFSYWEAERYLSMKKHLKKGMVLFDIGAEHGWLSVVYASLVGPANMVLIEPTQEFWPNIRATWERNCPEEPLMFYPGLIGDKVTDLNYDNFFRWPSVSKGDLIDRNKYQYIHDNLDKVPEMTLDEMVKRGSIVPDALTIDVDGAEHSVLLGAEKTLKKYHPLIWLSVHPDLCERDYNTTEEQITEYMKSLGYKSTLLGVDHERHWMYLP